MYAYFIGSAVALLILILMLARQRSDIRSIKELSGSLCDKWAQTEVRTKKIEKAVDWFLARHGMKLDYSSCSWEWNVVPTEKPKLFPDDAWHKFLDNRETIAYILYEANKKALEDWDREKSQAGKKKGGKK
jgi:hypothetical protein